MKVIIPVAGAGTKLRPHTYTQPKALIPMAGKTILSVIIDALTPFGFEEYIFVVGYLGDKIKDYVLKTYPDLNCTFVTQNERKGTGHAIYLTKEAAQNEELLIVYGDTICNFDVKAFIDIPGSVIGVKRVDDPRTFGVAEIAKDNSITKVVEKPSIPKSNMAMVGVYKIKETEVLYQVLEEFMAAQASDDGEYHFTAAMQKMIERKVHFTAFKMNHWFDCGKKDALLETNTTLLKMMEETQGQQSFDAFENSVIIPPVSIAKGCTIRNSIIGPSVSVGENSKIEASILQNSIIGSYATLEEVVLKSSVIGSDVYIHGMSQSLNIGDNTEIDLG